MVSVTPEYNSHASSEILHNVHYSDSNLAIVNDESTGLPNLAYYPSHVSHTHDAPIYTYTSHVEIPDEIYDRISPTRKLVIVGVLSFSSFLAPISSTTVLAAVPEVAETFNTTGTIINLSNAIYLVSVIDVQAKKFG